MTIRPIIRLVLLMAITALFLHQRLAPHSAGLSPRARRLFRCADRIFGPILKWLRSVFPPLPIGPGLSLESSHLILLTVLLTALTIV
jgi:hypothetical protein